MFQGVVLPDGFRIWRMALKLIGLSIGFQCVAAYQARKVFAYAVHGLVAVAYLGCLTRVCQCLVRNYLSTPWICFQCAE